jgi:Anti-sigma-K factor rskA
MNNPHDEMLEAVALLALGTLPQSEAEAAASHAAGCAECRAEYASLRTAADAIGYAAELDVATFDAASAARLKARVMDAVRSTATAPSAVVRPLRSAPSIAAQAARTSWLAYGAAAAALIVAVVSSANYVVLRKQSDADAAALAQARAFETQVARVVAPGSRYYEVPGGEVVASSGRVFLALRDLPAPGAGKVYQAWTLHEGAKAVAPSVTFLPDSNGVTLIELPESTAGLAAVAVSVEPEGGSTAPTTKPTFVRKLS